MSEPTLSESHELYGREVAIYDGEELAGIGVVDYAIGERFRVTLPGGRQPWGLIANLEGEGGALRYRVRATMAPDAAEG